MLPKLLKPYKPITIDKFRKHNQMLDGLHYCVLGFPEKNIDTLINSKATKDAILNSLTKLSEKGFTLQQ